MRACAICGRDLSDRRPDALTCSAKCRRERSRLLRLLSGEMDGPYVGLGSYLRRKRYGALHAFQGKREP